MDHGTLTSEFDLDPVDIGQGTQKVRPVTCCVECRKRKVKCDRLKPCGPCVAGSRSCVFVRTKRGTRSRIRSQQPATSTENHHSSRTTFGTSTLPDNPHFSAPSQFVTSIVEHKGGSATQTGTGDHSFYDGTYNHDSDEVEVEWTLRLGKLTISERIGGIFRPHAVDTLDRAIGAAVKHRSEYIEVLPPDPDNLWLVPNILNPSPSILIPGVTWTFQSDIIPSRTETTILFQQYFAAVDPMAHIINKPSFSLYQTSIEEGRRLLDTDMALVASVCFAAAVSMTPGQVEACFGVNKAILIERLKKTAETALKAANFMTTSKLKVLQAFTIYLIPQCRGDITRTHSVLVGALLRLAQCVGLHSPESDPGKGYLAIQMRRLLWHQILFLQIRTGEAQGPLPTERDDEVPMPLNINDAEVENPLACTDRWTDATFTIIRYECYEIHRVIFSGRVAVDKGRTTLEALFEKAIMMKDKVLLKYSPMLDDRIPIQRCARVVMSLLLARCETMVLEGRLPQLSDPHFRIAAKLRLVNNGLIIMESAVILETASDLAPWSWFSTTYQQYHTIIVFLLELKQNPDLPEAPRIGLLFDHVFGPVYGITRNQRVLDLLCLLRDCLDGYYKLRGLKSKENMVPSTLDDDSYTSKAAYQGLSPDINAHWFRTPQVSRNDDWTPLNTLDRLPFALSEDYPKA